MFDYCSVFSIILVTAFFPFFSFYSFPFSSYPTSSTSFFSCLLLPSLPLPWIFHHFYISLSFFRSYQIQHWFFIYIFCFVIPRINSFDAQLGLAQRVNSLLCLSTFLQLSRSIGQDHLGPRSRVKWRVGTPGALASVHTCPLPMGGYVNGRWTNDRHFDRVRDSCQWLLCNFFKYSVLFGK